MCSCPSQWWLHLRGCTAWIRCRNLKCRNLKCRRCRRCRRPVEARDWEPKWPRPSTATLVAEAAEAADTESRVRKHCVPSWAPACPAVGAKEDLQLHQKLQGGHRLLGHRLLLRQRRAVRYPHVTLCRSRLCRLWGNCFKGCYCPSSSSHPCHPRRFHRNHCFRWPSIRTTWAVRSCKRMGSRTRRSGYSSTLARHASERCKNGWIGSPPCTPPRRPASPCHPFHPQVRKRTPLHGQGTPGWPLVA